MAGSAEWSLTECGNQDAGRLAVIGSATFLEAFAGVLEGEDILAHCDHQHSQAKYAELLNRPGTRACLAILRGSPIGYALLSEPDLPVPVMSEDLELKRIYLLHRFHGMGIGSALMRWSMQTALASGRTRLLLGVYEQNASAISFYERHGFVRIGSRQFQVGRSICQDLILAADSSSGVGPRRSSRG